MLSGRPPIASCVQITSLFTIAGDATGKRLRGNRAGDPFSAGVGAAIAATASTAAAKRNIRPPEAEKRTYAGRC